MGVAAAFDTAFQLYNTSFLDPRSPWGTYDEEKGKTKADYLGLPITPAQVADDEAAEAESADDPE